MRVLVFRHVAHEHLGHIGTVLEAHGIGYEYADRFTGAASEVEADGLIFMGGPMSVNDNLPYIHAEVAVLRRAAVEGTPVLGVCLGAQLIAKALGARVYPNAVKEIGFAPVRFTATAHGDRLFRGLATPEELFHWHGETFDLAAGAELLASSERCRNQAFRYGTNVYGLQFHLEVTPAMIAEWIREDEGCGELRDAMGPIDPARNAGRLRELSETIFGRWCGILEDPCAA